MNDMHTNKPSKSYLFRFIEQVKNKHVLTLLPSEDISGRIHLYFSLLFVVSTIDSSFPNVS